MDRFEKLYRIIDGNHSITVKSDGGCVYLHGVDFVGRKLRILFSCGITTVPARKCLGDLEVNDCIVQDVDDGSVTFTRSKFLKEIHLCPHCGKEL